MQDADRSKQTARRLGALLCFALLCLAAAIRLFQLGERSAWLDEAYTYTRAALPAAQTIRASIGKGHLPTYFLFMHYFIAAFGDDETMLRLPSAIFGMVTVGLTVVLGRIVGGLRVGLVTGLLVAMSPLQVRYAQEARMYTMFTSSAAIALSGVLWLLVHKEHAGVALWHKSAWTRPASGGIRPGLAWLAYAAGATGVLYLHNTGVFLIATCSCAVLVLIAVTRGRRFIVLGNWVAANLVVLFFWSFWLANLMHQTKKVMTHFWPPFPTPRAIWFNLKDMYLYDAWRQPYLSALLAVLFMLGIFALRRRASLALGLLILAFLPPVLVLLVSLRTPMFMPRIMLWAPIPFFALCAAGLYAVPWRPLPHVLVLALLGGGAISLKDYYYGYTSKPPWREVAMLIESRTDDRTRVLGARTQDATVLNYYANRRTHPIGKLKTLVLPPNKLRRALQGVDTVWVVDQKRGRKAGKLRVELLHMGTVVRDERHDGLAVLEFKLGPPAGAAP
jgi:mannosyltransferase